MEAQNWKLKDTGSRILLLIKIGWKITQNNSE